MLRRGHYLSALTLIVIIEKVYLVLVNATTGTILALAVICWFCHDGSVKSPTYTLVEPYESVPGGPVFHLDLYRLGDAEELAFLGLGDYLSADGILLIEWPERAEAQLPLATLDITLTTRGSGRKATVRAADPVLLKALWD